MTAEQFLRDEMERGKFLEMKNWMLGMVLSACVFAEAYNLYMNSVRRWQKENK